MGVGGTLSDIAWDNASRSTDDNIFTPEFYGGADVRIYIGGKRYSNISSIQVSVREQQKPIYGYASRIYDDIAHGTRIVQGAIRVPVSNEGPKTKAVKQRARDKEEAVSKTSVDIPSWVYNTNNNYKIDEYTQEKKSNKNSKEQIKLINEPLYIAPILNSKIIKIIDNDIGNILLEKGDFLLVDIRGIRGYVKCKT